MREAQTEGQEKLLDALDEAARRIQYGELEVKFTFSRGQIKKMEMTEHTKNVLLD